MNWDEIQGNVTPGFRSGHQTLLFFQFRQTRDRGADVARARRWLDEIRLTVASAREVDAYNHLFRLIKHRTPDPAVEDLLNEDLREAEVYRFLRAVWVNVALTYAGLGALDARWRESFPAPFRLGPYRSKGPILNDLPPAQGAATAHVMLIVAADNPNDLKKEVNELVTQATSNRFGLAKVAQYDGNRLPGKKEHFGFRDGLSQPRLAGPLDGISQMTSTVAPGEFVFGYRGEDGTQAGFVRLIDAPFWVNDGSFLVFLRLHQDVTAFTQAVKDLARAQGRAPEHCAARLIGRWQSGAKIGHRDEAKDPGWPGEQAAQISVSDFADDPDGERFPLHCHIRKAFPRDRIAGAPGALWFKVPTPADARQHRLIRRGIPYGRPGDRDRGLLFVSYQTNIADQFEHVAREWMADVDFPRKKSGVDPLMHGLFRPPINAPAAPQGGAGVALQRYVTLTDGGYFFAPSRRTLAYLANPERGWSN